MDIKKKITEIVEEFRRDEELLEKFKKDPIGALEGLLGIDLPNEQLEQLADGIRAKLAADSIGEKLGGLGKLFGKDN